jgi:hypothetical protein
MNKMLQPTGKVLVGLAFFLIFIYLPSVAADPT